MMELEQNQELFQLMVESITDYAIFMLDPSGRVATWNVGAKRLKGYDANEIIGQHFSKFYLPADLAAKKPEHELETAIKTGRFEEEGLRVRKDGSTFLAKVIISAVRNSSGKLLGFSKLTKDVTERRNAELALIESEEHLKQMIHSVKDYAIIRLDPNGLIMSWNEGAKRLKLYNEEEVIGKHFSTFYTQEDLASGKPAWEIEEALKNGSVEDESWRIRKDGTKFWANVVITRLDNLKGKLIGFTKVTRDLTERKMSDERLKNAYTNLEIMVQRKTADLQHALNARDEFLSIASHELKTPLTSLKLQFQLLERRISSEENRMPSLEHLVKFQTVGLKQVNSLTNLIEDLLDISRIRTNKFTLTISEFDLSEFILEIISRFSEQIEASGCKIETHLESKMLVHLDQRRIEQVFINLMTNAFKYAPGSFVLISLTKKNDRLVLAIKDSGPGIAIDQQHKIFERFERANASLNVGGMGLGLFIVKQIVTAHQGSIQVNGRPGVGTEFSVDLPLRDLILGEMSI